MLQAHNNFCLFAYLTVHQENFRDIFITFFLWFLVSAICDGWCHSFLCSFPLLNAKYKPFIYTIMLNRHWALPSPRISFSHMTFSSSQQLFHPHSTFLHSLASDSEDDRWLIKVERDAERRAEDLPTLLGKERARPSRCLSHHNRWSVLNLWIPDMMWEIHYLRLPHPCGPVN